MVLQGFGVGLFQVAYFDIVTASIPRADRGVAGSLVMMTRTLGTVTGATVLMLLFQTWRDSAVAGGAREVPAFLAGFGFTFRVAAALPTVVVILGLLRGWGRTELVMPDRRAMGFAALDLSYRYHGINRWPLDG